MSEVAEDQLSRRVKQLSVFLPNRVGALLSVMRMLEKFDIRLQALSILDAADHAVARLVLDRPTLAREALVADGYNVVENDLLAVVLPPSIPFRKLLSVLLMGELNIHYTYALLSQNHGRTIIALHVDDTAAGARCLAERGFELVSQDEL
jgi:hypothetical protein